MKAKSASHISERLDELRAEARDCRACDLWARATQTVFGEGDARASLFFVGEQPGNDEDLQGRPFVGPAGRLLRRALLDAGIDEGHVYFTNAVKHFKWVEKGKRRIHMKPNDRQVAACKPWLESEIEYVDPDLVVALGATAAQAFFGKAFRVTQERGRQLRLPDGRSALVTVHPSSILRLTDSDERRAAYEAFVADLEKAAVLSKTSRAAMAAT